MQGAEPQARAGDPAWPRRQSALGRGAQFGVNRVSLTNSLFSTIDLRSFSNLWFWLVLAVAWSNVSHYIMGVPFDLVQRARRNSEVALQDLNALAAIQARRRMHILRTSGIWLIGFWAAALTLLISLGFVHGFELAQALALLLGPLSLVAGLGLRLAARVERAALTGADLVRALFWYRVMVQSIGLLAILITTLWGMWHNLSVRTLGG